jgi:lipopolysaccharide export LptBFGC system permease protein LptF
MKKLFIFFSLIFLTTACIGAPDNQVQESLSVKVDFKLKHHEKNGEMSQLAIKRTLKLASNDQEWTLIQNETKAKTPTNHILLGKISAMDANEVKLSFLIVDASNNPTIISRPELIVAYGQKGEVSLKEKNNSIQLSVTADHHIQI